MNQYLRTNILKYETSAYQIKEKSLKHLENLI